MKPRTKLPLPLDGQSVEVRGVFGRQWFLAVAFRAVKPPKPARSTEVRAA